jgi:signal transduction histidine kinase
MSFNDARVQLINDLRTDLLLSAGATVLISVGIYLLVHWLIVRRVEAFRFPLMKFAKGDFSSRLDTPVNPRDEIDQLAWAFNRTADELERHQHEQEQRHDLRRRAIIEERERIAREIHDGIAQLMGYVSTKAAAVRLLLEKQQLDEAQIQAHQLMRASQEAFVELRATILGLRTSDTDDTDFVAMLEEFSSKFSQMSGIEVDTMFPSDRDKISLPPDTELHLLRITQEALSNVQKHTSTKQAWVALTVEDHTLELTIGDNGRGFDPTQIPANRRPHFGLSTMSERASAIGATFVLDSKPGEGTRVSVRLPLE